MLPLLLGIDVGTGSAKAVLTTPDGSLLAEATASYKTDFPQAGWAEQNPNDWWQGVVESVRQVLAAPQVQPDAVAAIGISGQGCAVTLIDEAGQPIRPAIIWRDSRSEPQCEVLRQTVAEDVMRLNGKSPAPYNADPVLMWLSEHEPESIEKAQTSLTTTGYITYCLTGEPVLNVSDASILFAFDLSCMDWSDALIAAFGVPRYLYPRVAPCIEVIGELQPESAQALGLPPGIPVIAGGEDTSSAGLAIGVAQSGQTLLSLGTAGTIYVVQDQPHVHPALLAFAHVLPGQVLLGGSMIAGGGVLNFCQQIFGADLSFEQLTMMASHSPPGANQLIFLPYLSGEMQPINDGNARGVFLGLSTATTQADMVRAAMEGTAYAITHNMRIAAEVGTPITEIRAVGGPTRSPLWCQMIADVSGYPLTVLPGNTGAPLGNALLAAAGVGLIDDPAAAAAANIETQHTYQPNPEHRERYHHLFEIYRRLYPQLSASFADLVEISS